MSVVGLYTEKSCQQIMNTLLQWGRNRPHCCSFWSFNRICQVQPICIPPFLWQVHTRLPSKDISIGSAVFAGLTVVTATLTNTLRYSNYLPLTTLGSSPDMYTVQ